LLPGAQASGLFSTAAVSQPFVSSGSAETIVEPYSTPRPAPQSALTYLPAAATQTVPQASTTSLPPAAEYPGLRKRHWWLFAALLILVAVAVAGTTFFLTVHQRPQRQMPLDSAAVPPPMPAMPSSNTPPMQGGAGGAPTELTSQDPGKNTHLGLDLSNVPPFLRVALEMDGKIYWAGSPRNQPSYERLLVPPGKHQFRVVVSGSGEPKFSNLVKAASDPSMRLTLAVDLRPRPVANAVTLDPATRVIATIKPPGPHDATGRQSGGQMHGGPQQSPGEQNAPQQ